MTRCFGKPKMGSHESSPRPYVAHGAFATMPLSASRRIAIDPSFAVALVNGEVGAVRIENLERTKGLGQQLVPAAVGAEVDKVADRQDLVLRPHPAVPVSLLASLVLVEGSAHRRNELLQALIDGALHHERGAIGGCQRGRAR